jgi:hypothetical protein
MSFRRGLIAGLSLVAITGLMVAPAASAAEKKKKGASFKVVSASATSPGAVAPGLLTATALCPSKTKAVGGGFVSSGPASDDLALQVESVRVRDTGWRTSGLPNDFGVTVTSIVYCAKVKTKITEVQTPATLGGGPFATAAPEAACPRKTRLLAGGFSASSTGTISFFIYESARQSSGAWGVKALRAVNGDPSPVTAHAYCVKKPKVKGAKKAALASKAPKSRPKSLLQLFASATLPAAQYGRATATTGGCPGKRKGVSGGFSTPPPSTAHAPAIVEAQWVNGAWSVTASQFTTATDGGPFTAYGYCG